MARAFFIFWAVALNLACAVGAGEWMKFPDYRKTVLPNGVTLLLVEKHGAPLIYLSLAMRSGSTQDPQGKEGLADLTNDLLRKGAGARTADQISDDLDFIGAALSTTIGIEITRVQFECMKKDLTNGMDIFADLILRPKFPEDEVSKIKEQRVDELKAQKDHPNAVIGQYYKQFLFGSHPYGRSAIGTEVSVPTITRENIVQFHEKTYVSSNLVFVACGDFETADMEKRLKEKFGGLPPRDIARAPVSPLEPSKGTRLLLVDKPDATQTFFRIGNIGTAVTEPDRVAISLANTIFGGRFTSRLNTALRIDSGLSYGASSGFESFRQPGSFHIGSFTKNASTDEALAMALKVLRTLHDKGLTDAEIASAKAYLKGQFGPTLETADQIAGRLAFCEIYGLDPRQEVDQYAARLDAVTAADLRRVLQKAYPQKDLVFTIVGKGSEIAPLMQKYATTVQTCVITDPGFGAK